MKSKLFNYKDTTIFKYTIMTIPFTPDAANAEFRLAIDFIEHTDRHVFLTGKAGSGKTTLLKYLREHSRKKMIVAAPTGVAAVNASGVTLHSLFQLPIEPFVPNESGARRLAYRMRMSSEKIRLLRTVDLLVIDEVSMLRADMLDAVDTVLRRVRRSREPMGGLQVLFIGDLFQLPPVVREEDKPLMEHYYRSPFFFHAHVFQPCLPVYIELKTVYRQQEEEFIDLLNSVRHNNLAAEEADLLNARYFPAFQPAKGEQYIVLTTHNYRAERINKERLADLAGNEVHYPATVEGDFADYAMPTDRDLVLKPGAQVMFVKNDGGASRRYYNGKLGFVTGLSEDTVYVLAEGELSVFEVKRERWTTIRYTYDNDLQRVEEEETGAFIQFPLRLAWAVTIHKSQGLTFERAVIDAGQSFAPGQVYVALSRCRSLDGLVLTSELHPEVLKTDPQVKDFVTQHEMTYADLSDMLEKEMPKFWRARLLQAFDWSPLLQALYEWRDQVQRKKFKTAPALLSLIHVLELALKGQQEVAQRFVPRLQESIDYALQSGDFTGLKNYLQRAGVYFHAGLCHELLNPLDGKINEAALVRGMKQHRSMLEDYRSVVAGFMLRLCTLDYGGLPLVEGLLVPPIPPVTVMVPPEGE